MALKFYGGGPIPPDENSPLAKLPKTAQSINEATAHLNEAVDKLNAAFKKLNLGIPAWVEISSQQEGPFLETEEIGYDKVGGKWAISLRTISDDKSTQDETDPEINYWHFADAPREMRIRAVKHLNELIEKLNDNAEKAAQKILERATNAETLAQHISVVADAAAANRAAQKKGGK